MDVGDCMYRKEGEFSREHMNMKVYGVNGDGHVDDNCSGSWW
jgi:hypothetical protein